MCTGCSTTALRERAIWCTISDACAMRFCRMSSVARKLARHGTQTVVGVGEVQTGGDVRSNDGRLEHQALESAGRVRSSRNREPTTASASPAATARPSPSVRDLMLAVGVEGHDVRAPGRRARRRAGLQRRALTEVDGVTHDGRTCRGAALRRRRRRCRRRRRPRAGRTSRRPLTTSPITVLLVEQRNHHPGVVVRGLPRLRLCQPPALCSRRLPQERGRQCPCDVALAAPTSPIATIGDGSTRLAPRAGA